MKILNLTIALLSIFQFSCENDSITEIMNNELNQKRLSSSNCEKKMTLQFDTEDLVINFGGGWQNQSFDTFQLTWLNDNTLKIKSFYAINHASMIQATGFPIQNYEINYLTSYEITINLNSPSLWYIYGEHYHLFKIDLTIDICKPNVASQKR